MVLSSWIVRCSKSMLSSVTAVVSPPRDKDIKDKCTARCSSGSVSSMSLSAANIYSGAQILRSYFTCLRASRFLSWEQRGISHTGFFSITPHILAEFSATFSRSRIILIVFGDRCGTGSPRFRSESAFAPLISFLDNLPKNAAMSADVRARICSLAIRSGLIWILISLILLSYMEWLHSSGA